MGGSRVSAKGSKEARAYRKGNKQKKGIFTWEMTDHSRGTTFPYCKSVAVHNPPSSQVEITFSRLPPPSYHLSAKCTGYVGIVKELYNFPLKSPSLPDPNFPQGQFCQGEWTSALL